MTHLSTLDLPQKSPHRTILFSLSILDVSPVPTPFSLHSELNILIHLLTVLYPAVE